MSGHSKVVRLLPHLMIGGSVLVAIGGMSYVGARDVTAQQAQQTAQPAATPEGYMPRGWRPGKGLAPGMKVADLGKGARTFRVSMTKGDEIMSGLTEFAETYHIKHAHFTALGAINKGVFGWTDVERGLGQKKIELNQEAEIVSLMGSMSVDNQGRSTVHGHGSVALTDGSVKGGHWFEAYVSIIAEAFVTEEEGAPETSSTQQPGTAPANVQPAGAAAPPKLQALIITGQHAGHDWKSTTPLLRKALEDTGKFEVRVTEEFRGGGPETLAPYDLVILNYSDRGRPELRWGDRGDNALLDYVRSGKGLVVYHFSMQAFDGWTEYEKMSAGNWRPNNGHHSARHNYVVDVKDADHPITKGLKLSFPQPNDELYANLRWQPVGSYHVLATAYDDHELYKASRTDSRAPQPLTGAGANEPMLWTVDYGKGHVFVTALGHDAETVQTPAFVTTFARGSEWAATGKVTLPIPAGMAK
ncbi:MAG TPA: DUF296 domain-containing protein [Vicinamibacterales bacterium]|nr:DUF296 domain-containing protein [Vicinamibacterales bacterium]